MDGRVDSDTATQLITAYQNSVPLKLASFANTDVSLTASFVEKLYAQLQAQKMAVALVQTWVEQKLLEQDSSLGQLLVSTSPFREILILNIFHRIPLRVNCLSG